MPFGAVLGPRCSSLAVPGGDTDGKVRELTARLSETKRQRQAALSKQETTQSALSEAQTRLLELEADNRALVADVKQAKDNEAEVSKRRDEEVRHLREQVEQLILSFNSAQSQTSSAPPSKSPSPTAHVQEAEPPTPLLSAPPPVSAGAASASAAAAYDSREATAAATHVQSVWRGFTDRRKLSDLMEDLGYFDEGGDFSLTSFHYVSLAVLSTPPSAVHPSRMADSMRARCCGGELLKPQSMPDRLGTNCRRGSGSGQVDAAY